MQCGNTVPDFPEKLIGQSPASFYRGETPKVRTLAGVRRVPAAGKRHSSLSCSAWKAERGRLSYSPRFHL